MNIFVINGSPKGERSNTWQLTKFFLEGMKQGISEKNKEEAVQIGRASCRERVSLCV